MLRINPEGIVATTLKEEKVSVVKDVDIRGEMSVGRMRGNRCCLTVMNLQYARKRMLLKL